MKKVIVSISLLISLISFAEILKDNGLQGRTGSPGETTCVSCHNTNAINTGGGSVVISCETMVDWKYQPGVTYPITVTVQKAGSLIFGLGFEALNNTTGSTHISSGTLQAGVGTQIKTATVSGGNRPNIVHITDGGLANDTKTFTFNWTAPSVVPTNSTIVFYCAALAGNNNNASSGDFVYTTTQTISPLDPTRLTELKETVDFEFFPNPATSKVIIDVKNLGSEILTLQILNTQGKKVLAESIKQNVSEIQLPENLSNGIYFVKISNQKSVQVKKIIVAN